MRNPDRFAEVILGQVAGWSSEDVARQLKIKTTTRIDLQAHLPVHNTYLTTWVNSDGTVMQFKDVYGHDKRYSEALAGKSVKLIAARDPALVLKKENEELRKGFAAIYTPRPKPVAAPTGFFFWGPPPPPAPWSKSGLGKPKPAKKYYSAAPPRPLYFQRY